MAQPQSTLVQFARVFEKTSDAGRRYFVGRLGPSRILMFLDERSESEDPEWQIFVAEIPGDAKSTTPRTPRETREPRKTRDRTAQRAHTKAQVPSGVDLAGGDAPIGQIFGEPDGR